jgi:PAS domain S-box-containing protein
MLNTESVTSERQTILLVEDEVVIALGKKPLLEEQGYTFLHATDSSSALNMIAQHPEISLVLMDMHLGYGPDGAETSRLILEKRQLPIVFLTAYTDRKTIDSIRMIQHYGYVTKSSGDFVLLNAIETALGLFKARMEAKASEEKFRLAVENSLDVLIFADAEGRQFFVSPSAEKLTGFTIEELLGPFDRVIHPDDIEKVRQAIMDAAMHPERTIRVEYRHKHKDGSYRNIETIGRSYLPPPELHCIVASARDVTDRLRTEENLRQTMHNLQRSQQVAHVGNWELDLTTNTLISSDEGMRIWGFEPGTILQFAEMTRCIHPKDIAAAHEKMQQALAEKKGYTVDLRIFRKDNGELRYITSIGEVICDAEGKPVRIFGTNQDITERKLAEKALAAEKERLSVTLRSIGEGVITTDTKGQILMMNETAEKMTGWSQDQAGGSALEEVFRLLSETTGLALDNPAQQVLVTGRQLDIPANIMLQNRDGSKRSITMSASPIYDAQRIIIGVVVVFRDMSEKVKMLDMLQQSQKLESLGVLAGGIAHDFNNLLSGIFGYISRAREMASDSQAVTDNLDQALKVYTRATDLTAAC